MHIFLISCVSTLVPVDITCSPVIGTFALFFGWMMKPRAPELGTSGVYVYAPACACPPSPLPPHTEVCVPSAGTGTGSACVSGSCIRLYSRATRSRRRTSGVCTHQTPGPTALSWGSVRPSALPPALSALCCLRSAERGSRRGALAQIVATNTLVWLALFCSPSKAEVSAAKKGN